VSLGFAALENAFFVIAAGDWKVIAAARAITAVPAHGICGLVMGALLVAARLSGKKITAALALIVPVILHAAYDFPLLAIDKNVAREFFAGIWLLILILSSVFAILLSNRMGRKAREADVASGRDWFSNDAATSLIWGGVLALLIGPALAIAGYYFNGREIATAAAAASIFPFALGIDAILTGFRRRRIAVRSR